MTTRAQVQSAIENMEEEVIRLEDQASTLRTLIEAAKVAKYTLPNEQSISSAIYEGPSDRLANV
jgi:hypothetical protein